MKIILTLVLFFALIAATSFSTKNQAQRATFDPSSVFLSGETSNGISHLWWTWTESYTILRIKVQQKINCGNTKNCWLNIATLEPEATQYSIPDEKGKTTYRIIIEFAGDPGGTAGDISNNITI